MPKAINEHAKDFEIFAVLVLKKKRLRNKELTAVEFEPGTTQSKITELPTKPRGSQRVQLNEKAIWHVSFFVQCCRCAFFATSMFERASLLLISMLAREFVLFQELFVVHGDVLRRMICSKKTFTNSLVEAKSSENVREKFAIVSKQYRTMTYG